MTPMSGTTLHVTDVLPWPLLPLVSAGVAPNHDAPPLTGAQIRDLRDARGWSQKDLADAVGVSLRTVGRWENGTKPVDPRKRGLLLRALRLVADDSPSLKQATWPELMAELTRRITIMERGLADKTPPDVDTHGTPKPPNDTGGAVQA